MKKLYYFGNIFVILIYICINHNENLLAQGIERGEFMIVNNTNLYPIMIKVFPVGAVFNADKQYSPRLAGAPLPNQVNVYITGIQDTLESSAPGYAVRAQFDGFGGTNGCKFAVGYGLYKIEFWKESVPGYVYDVLVDTCLMDWRDANLANYPSPFGNADIIFDFYGDSTKFRYLTGNSIPVRIDRADVNRHVKFWDLLGTTHVNEPWYPIIPSKGLFYPDNSNPIYLNYPIDCRNFGAPDHQGIQNIEMNLKIDIPSVSNITMKTNESLIFKNGASLVARNVTFNTTTSGSAWNKIELENSGSDTIINCTFNNAKTSVSVINDNVVNNPNKIIRKNTFNISQDNGRGMDVRNLNKILIDSNTFNFSNSNSTVGIYFRNSDPSGDAPQPNFLYSLNIVNNKFINGYLPILATCLTSSRTPFYIYRNTFTGNSTYSIGGVKITGDIKNNTFDVNNNNRSIGLWNSNPNVFGNSFKSISTNMYLNVSFPSMSPAIIGNNQLAWTGGKNFFYSTQLENIYLDGSYPYLNNGRNVFSINSSAQKHLFGRMPDTVNLYKMTYNCWTGNNDLPSYFLYKIVNDITLEIPVIHTPTYCETAGSPLSVIITDKGNGIYDTTMVTNNTATDTPPEDEVLLNQARASFQNQNYPNAITNYKGLIDNFIVSEFIYTSLYEMYDNYSSLDTSGNQVVIDILFGDLRQYLQNKINSQNYNEDFINIAFDIILMCETRMKNFEVALTGYEFIALYHPNAEQRMIASWDYEDIEDLINGGGGGEKDLGLATSDLRFGIKEYEIEMKFESNEIRRINKLIDDDPLMKTLKKNYDRIIVNDKHKKTDKLTDDRIVSRAKENIFKSKFLKKEEKEKRFIEDITLLMSKNSIELKGIENKIYEPQNFVLHQNYPNPFNPVTSITFEIPASSFVTLTVFDITGKEIQTLINENKNAGTYQVTFSGANLSSGIYYVQLQSGNISQIRKMMLIK